MTTLLLLLIAVAGMAFAYNHGRRASLKESAAEKKNDIPQHPLVPELVKKVKSLEAELVRKREFVEQVPPLISKLMQEFPKDSLPPLGVRFAKNYFHARQVGYFVPVENSAEYTLEVGVGFPPDWQGNVRFASNEGILEMAIRKKVVVAKCDPLTSSGTRSLNPSLERSGVDADFVAPVFGVSGIAGVLVIAGCPYSHEEERTQVSMLADLLSGALQRAALADISKSSSWVDPLTGAANRLYFAQRFETEIRRAQNYQQPLALVILDIDEFKKINDTFGHPVGDVVIKRFAQILRSNTRSSDLVCRYGGDEFIVLMTSSSKEQVLVYIDHLKKIIAETEIPVPRHGGPIHLTASGGVAIFPSGGQTTTDLLRTADDALYEAKRMGRNRIIVSDSKETEGSIFDAEGAETGKNGIEE